MQVTAQARRGEDAFLRVCGEGDILGKEVLLPKRERPDGRAISATALTQSTTLAVSRDAFLNCFDSSQQLREGLVWDLIARIAEAEERIARLACDSSDERLAWLLVRYARSSAAPVSGADGSPGLPVSLSIDGSRIADRCQAQDGQESPGRLDVTRGRRPRARETADQEHGNPGQQGRHPQ